MSHNDDRKKIGFALTKIYNLLFKLYGPRHWWPADGAFEVVVGAILTQNTNWANVEKAIFNLRRSKALAPGALFKITLNRLAGLIRPCGYYNIKARRLKNFIAYLFSEYSGDIEKMRLRPIRELRSELLAIKGVGPETADSILLYALNKPTFVIDTYTKRILNCQGIAASAATYDEMQTLVMDNLPRNRRLYNEYHALFVEHAKRVCRTRPECTKCILRAAGVRHFCRNTSTISRNV